MKIKSTAVLLASLAILSVNAAEITLSNGETAQILSQNGIVQGYVKEVADNDDGKSQFIPGEVFSGVRIVQKKDGICVKVNTSLIAFRKVMSGRAFIEIPELTVSESPVRCSSTEG